MLTQVSLILLLYGTLCGGLAFLADVARMMVLKGIPADAPQQQHSPPPTLGLLGVTEAAASALPPFVERWVEGLREWFAHTALPVMRQDGRPLMLVVVATILYPLCLQKHIRQVRLRGSTCLLRASRLRTSGALMIQGCPHGPPRSSARQTALPPALCATLCAPAPCCTV